jgi:hypothetical protein
MKTETNYRPIYKKITAEAGGVDYIAGRKPE